MSGGCIHRIRSFSLPSISHQASSLRCRCRRRNNTAGRMKPRNDFEPRRSFNTNAGPFGCRRTAATDLSGVFPRRRGITASDPLAVAAHQSRASPGHPAYCRVGHRHHVEFQSLPSRWHHRNPREANNGVGHRGAVSVHSQSDVRGNAVPVFGHRVLVWIRLAVGAGTNSPLADSSVGHPSGGTVFESQVRRGVPTVPSTSAALAVSRIRMMGQRLPNERECAPGHSTGHSYPLRLKKRLISLAPRTGFNSSPGSRGRRSFPAKSLANLRVSRQCGPAVVLSVFLNRSLSIT
jgi:hypothetical protein